MTHRRTLVILTFTVIAGGLVWSQFVSTMLDDVRLVSITITPEDEQPAVLREYAERFQDLEKWLFLTGARAEITKLANDGFWLSAGSPVPVTHSEKFVLVDREGKVRGLCDGNKAESVPQLVEAIDGLIRTK